MAIVTTYHNIGATFYGPTGSRSTIGHVALPRAAVTRINKCEVWRHPGKALQLIPHKQLRDHMPVMLDFDYYLDMPKPQKHGVRWNRDASAMLMQRGWKRKEFVVDLEEASFHAEETFGHLEQENTTDKHYKEFWQTIGKVAEKHFVHTP